MEEQFLNFLSDNLLKFCSYDTHKHNYSAGSIAITRELDALTNLSSKEVEEYFAEQGGDSAVLTMLQQA